MESENWNCKRRTKERDERKRTPVWEGNRTQDQETRNGRVLSAIIKKEEEERGTREQRERNTTKVGRKMNRAVVYVLTRFFVNV